MIYKLLTYREIEETTDYWSSKMAGLRLSSIQHRIYTSVILGRIAMHSIRSRRPFVADVAWSACLCVSAGHDGELCKDGRTDQEAV